MTTSGGVAVEEPKGGSRMPAQSSGDVTSRLTDRGMPARWIGVSPSAPLAGVTGDSRRVREGTLFVAIRGSRADGHAFVADAAAAGAATAVVEHPVAGASLPQLVVGDTRTALTHLASLFAGDPARSLRLVGVTGTNGKTTTVWVARHLLAGRAPTGALGTLGLTLPDGHVRPGRLTTPDPVELMGALADLREAGARIAALEASSHALDQRRADALEFECAVFTNLTRDHLDYHPDAAAYLAAKLRLAELVSPEGTCAVNADDPAWQDADFSGRRVRTFGVDGGADVRARGVRPGPGATLWRLEAGEEQADVRLPLLGTFNVANALGAATAALALGMELDEVAERLSSVPQVPGRLEVLARRPFVVVRDYAHTPDALGRAIEALRPLADGRLIVLFGCGGDRDRGKRPLMGEVVAEGADLAVVTSDNPRSEDPAAIIADILPGIGSAEHEVVPDRREAIARAMNCASPGDMILLAGKGHERVQVVGSEELPFDEAAIVADLLAGGTVAP